MSATTQGHGVGAKVRPAYAEPAAELWGRFGTRPGGLTDEEAAARRLSDVAQREPSRAMYALRELAESLVEPLQLLLISVGVLSAIFGELRDAVAIFVIIAMVAAVEAISEARARRALRALRDLSAPSALVRRAGTVRSVAPEALVVGDVLVLETGDLVAGDARVIDADGLATDESTLTGEAASAAKGTGPVAIEEPLGERSSMVYAGTAVVAGAGDAVVVATGPETEIGRLGRLVSEVREPPTPLQRAMRELAHAALIVAVAASVLVPLLGVLRGQPLRQMLLDGLTLAFATIPEELPILVTVLVAVGGLRLAKRGVLLRKLRAAEGVGAITVLVTDKTGTLTENRLRLDRVEGDRDRLIDTALAAHGGAATQDPVDRALADAANHQPWPGRAQRYPFDPVRKRESAVWTDADGVRVAVKGAPESVLDVCAISDAERQRVLTSVERLAHDGLRVIAVAERRGSRAPSGADDAERDLEYIGLVVFRDPLREGVPEAVAQLANAGVRTIVVSGDHPSTVAAVARSAGLRDFDLLLGGAELERVADKELAAGLRAPLVIARATPEDKLRLVRLLQQQGEAVAVTGDGVNDAPALAAADVGIAMGARGTDLAREAADLVLTDDAYPTIVTAVAGGRGLAAQLRRAVAFYLGAKVALVTVIAVPLALGLPSPFGPVHIVLLELFMDLGASVAFVSEPAVSGAMARAPRDPSRRFLDRAQSAAIGLTALALTASVLPAYVIVHGVAGAETAAAAAIAAWLVAHAAIAWSLRIRPRLPLRGNVAFPAWASVATLTAALVALTPAGQALGIEPLTASGIAITIAAALAGVAVAAAGRRALALPQRL